LYEELSSLQNSCRGDFSLHILATVAALLNSFWFNPDPTGDTSFISRAQKKTAAGIQVSISALGAREAVGG